MYSPRPNGDSSSQHPKKPLAPSPLKEVTPSDHEVLVPCFVKIRVKADDELHAEVLAQSAVRKLGQINVPAELGVSSMAFHSLLGPVSQKV